jgi:hypothetical protein
MATGVAGQAYYGLPDLLPPDKFPKLFRQMPLPA